MSDYRRGGHGSQRGGGRGGYDGGRGGGRGGYDGGRGGGRGGYDGGRGGGRGGYDGGRGGGRGGYDGGRGGGRGGYDGGRGGGRGGYDGGRGGGRGGYDGGRGGGRGRGRGNDDIGPWPDPGFIPPRHVIAEKDKPDNPFKRLKAVAGLQIERSLAYRSKPKPGNSGRKVQLLTNYFMLNCTFKKSLIVHHYDVTIERQITPTSGDEAAAASETIPGSRKRAVKLEKRFNRQIIDKMVDDYGRDGNIFHGIIPVYDYGKNMYTKKPLNMKSKFAVTDEDGTRLRMEVVAKECREDEPTTFVVVIKHAADIIIDPSWTIFPQEAIQFIDICLRYGPTRDNIPIGCKIFFPEVKRRRERLPMNKQLAFGFYQSARNCEGGLMLNVDRAAAVFHKGGKILTVFDEIFKGTNHEPPIPPHIIREMSKELSGMRIKVTHLRYVRKMRVSGFSQQSAAELMFPLEIKDENGKVKSKEQVSVANYFKTQYKKELSFPNLPCLVVGSKKSAKYFPLEVCELLPDQYVAKKLNAKVLSEMSQYAAAQKPNARFKEITDAVKDCIRREGPEYDNEFGLNVGTELVQLEGRVLEAPTLQYENRLFKPQRECAWMMQKDHENKPDAKRFFRSVPINKWVLVDMSPGDGYPGQFLKEFSERMMQTARTLGVEMKMPIPVRHSFTNTNKLRHIFINAREEKNVQLIVFLLPDKDECYYAVKKLGDLDFGIPTQCCSIRHYSPNPKYNKLLQTAYLTNVMLKINAKMNGLNTILDVGWAASKKIMFVGVDVTHPAPGAKYELSIASCVGSYDNSFVRYIAKLTAQEQTRREIVNLDRMMLELLEAYKKQNGYWPETIIVYRDGVSEGQFDHVLAYEFTMLVRLFDQMKMKVKPKVTYIVVQKRHHTRFLTVRKQDSSELNVPAGTTVDTVITDPVKFDFFICSHQGLLGTSRPSRYWVLFDQNNYSPDEIQQITYFMCFLYPRCTRSVSIPVPVEFAHLSAYRARHHVAEVLGSDISSGASVSSEGSNEEAKEKQRQEYTKRMNDVIKVNPDLSTRLYYL